MVDFKQLIKDLMKRAIAKTVSHPIMRVREHYNAKVKIRNHDELVDEVAGYYNELQKGFLKTDVDMPVEASYSEVLRLLRIETLVPVYDRCVHGYDGGLPKVIDRITEVYHDQAVEKYINYKLTTAISHPLADDEIEELLTIWVKTIGVPLGIELTEVRNMAHRWQDIIKQHALSVSSYQALCGRF